MTAACKSSSVEPKILQVRIETMNFRILSRDWQIYKYHSFVHINPTKDP